MVSTPAKGHGGLGRGQLPSHHQAPHPQLPQSGVRGCREQTQKAGNARSQVVGEPPKRGFRSECGFGRLSHRLQRPQGNRADAGASTVRFSWVWRLGVRDAGVGRLAPPEASLVGSPPGHLPSVFLHPAVSSFSYKDTGPIGVEPHGQATGCPGSWGLSCLQHKRRISVVIMEASTSKRLSSHTVGPRV